MSFFQIFTPNPNKIAEKQLQLAEVALLEAQEGQSYAESMVAHYTRTIARLKRQVKGNANLTSPISGEC